MALKVIISGSRESEERKIIHDILYEKAGYHIHLYDCNDTATTHTYEGKQEEINRIISNYDWFILIASTEYYGGFTYKEWEAVTNSILKKPNDQVITVLKCTNVTKSQTSQRIKRNPEKDIYIIEDFEKLCHQKGIGINFYCEYTYDEKFDNLTKIFNKELEKLLAREFVLRQDSISLKDMKPTDVYMNKFRASVDNGFREDSYLVRDYIDHILDIQQGCSFVIGPSASGKTRAVYEYLKRESKKNNDDINKRLIVVNRNNLLTVCKHVADFAKFKNNLRNPKDQDLSSYYFLFDQIGDLLYKQEYISAFDDLYHDLTTQFHARMLVTALQENYEGVIKKECCLNEDSSPIYISSLKEDRANWNNIRTFFKLEEDEEIDKVVIGQYITGLVDYNNSLKREIQRFYEQNHNNDLVEKFVKAYCVIGIYRKLSLPPLALVLAVMNKITGENITKRQLLDGLLEFFFRMHVLVISEEGEEDLYDRVDAVEADIDLEEDMYEYDGEQLSLPMSPDFLIQIEDDYLWQEFFVKEYAYTLTDIASMKNAMTYFSKAFISENPLVTLRRIIARSPSLTLALKYDAHEDFVGDFVQKQFTRLYNRNKLSKYTKGELCEILAYLIHRSENFDKFKERFTFAEEILREGRYALPKDHSSEDVSFLLNETNVAELMGFGSQRGQTIKSQILKFLEEKGWNFKEYEGQTIYYHIRVVQYQPDFESVQQYVTTHILPRKEKAFQTSYQSMHEAEKSTFIMNCISHCNACEDMLQVLDWTEALHVEIKRRILYQLINLKKNDARWLCNPIANKKIVERIANLLLSNENDKQQSCQITNASYERKEPPISPAMRYYYLVCLSSTFANAKSYFKTGLKNYWKDNKELKDRAISQWIESMRNYEFAYMYNEFFHNGCLTKELPLPLVSRNLLLKQLNVSDGIFLLDYLFDGSTPDSTADINTLISLLTTNKEFLRNHANQNDKVDTNTRFSFQNLKMILLHPRLKHITYNESATNLILYACHTQDQENRIMEDFLRPNWHKWQTIRYKDEDLNGTFKSKEDEHFNKIKAQPEYAINHLLTIYEMKDLVTYAKTFIEQIISAQPTTILNPSFITNLFNRMYYLFIRSYGQKNALSIDGFKRYTREMYNFLFGSTPGVNDCVMNSFFKDNYFYTALYRLYPERAVHQVNGSYEWTQEFKNLSNTFIDEKMFGNILVGLATFMGEEALKAIEIWIFEHIENYEWNRSITTTVKKIIPHYRFHPSNKKSRIHKPHATTYSDKWVDLNRFFRYWENNKRIPDTKYFYHIPQKDFELKVLKPIRSIKAEDADSTPNISTVINVFKNGFFTIQESFIFLEEVYLNYDLVITPTLWKTVLENIQRCRGDRQNPFDQQNLINFRNKHKDHIFEDATTLSLEINLFIGEEQVRCFEQLQGINTYRTQIELSNLINCPQLYLTHFDKYIQLMQDYIDDYVMLFETPHPNETYNHFIKGLVTHYSSVKEQIELEQKKFIYTVLKFIYEHQRDKDKSWYQDNIGQNLYYEMLADLQQALGKDTTELKAILADVK